MSFPQEQALLWSETPLLLSSHLSTLLGCNVYLKLENLQISQSFKYRGKSLFAQHCKTTRGDNAHLIVASCGNAGLATACAANHLGLKCSVYIPEGTDRRTIKRLEREKAQVVDIGKSYHEAAQEAVKAVERDENACYVHGYDGTILRKGHGSMISEILRQLNQKPDAVFCSVGGGGLLGGIIEGCTDVGWDDVPIVAAETHGAAAFYHSISINGKQCEAKPSLPDDARETYDTEHGVKIANVKITSRVASLSATSPAPFVVKAALDRKGGITCVTIPDEMAMATTCLFAEDHKFLVELACSTTLALAYHPDLFRRIRMTHLPKGDEEWRNVVFIVCGGVKISVDEVYKYETVVQDFLRSGKRHWDVLCNGEQWDITVRLVEQREARSVDFHYA